jgi:hypothetical protein
VLLAVLLAGGVSYLLYGLRKRQLRLALQAALAHLAENPRLTPLP